MHVLGAGELDVPEGICVAVIEKRKVNMNSTMRLTVINENAVYHLRSLTRHRVTV
jgi:hypothetical protein